MHIHRPKIVKHGQTARYTVQVDHEDRARTLWYEVDAVHGDLISARADAALVALLIPAMIGGCDIHMEGTVSERLFYSVSRQCQALLQTVYPKLHRVNIYAEEVKPAERNAKGVATGFSGGIDSFSVLADHHYTPPPPGFQITHLLYNNVGSHAEGGERLFRQRYNRLKPAAERIGLPFIAVNSNVDAFYEGIRFRKTHTFRNASVGLLLQEGISCFLYASGTDYSLIKTQETYDSAYFDPITLPLLSTEALDALSVGCEYTRVEKTLQVAGLEDAQEFLDVCIRDDNPSNCSTCWKCKRTLLTLEIAGLLDRFDNVFDLDAYRSVREKYLVSVLNSSEPLIQEIVEFANQQNYIFPFKARMHSLARSAKYKLLPI